MISFVSGTVDSYGTDWLVVENNGIGYYIHYPHPESVTLGQQIKIHTYLNVREDELSLFGFESREELEFFESLIKVKGLGPKTAMTMLAKHSYDNIIQSIETGNISFLKAIPGIGAKTASQIILDLKGKLVSSKQEETYSSDIQDAVAALKNLGYKQGEVNQAAKRMNEEAGLTTEEYLKIGLQFLMKKKIGG